MPWICRFYVFFRCSRGVEEGVPEEAFGNWMLQRGSRLKHYLGLEEGHSLSLSPSVYQKKVFTFLDLVFFTRETNKKKVY